MENTKEASIQIPTKKEELGSLIISLLGQPQSIEREVFGFFDINHSDIT